MQWATPSRILVFVPSMILEAWCAVRLMPFSACKLPFGTTKLELVTSGRSVWISLWASGQYSAAKPSTMFRASAASRSATTNANRTAFMTASLRHFAGCNTGRRPDLALRSGEQDWDAGRVGRHGPCHRAPSGQLAENVSESWHALPQFVEVRLRNDHNAHSGAGANCSAAGLI